MIEHRDAALLVETALGRVADPAVVGQARADSPLEALGLGAGDAVCLADAVAQAAEAAGMGCRLGDAEFADVRTVGDLIDAVMSAATTTNETAGG